MLANGSRDKVPILVVEDDPDMAREIAAQLTSLGYLARIAETGAAGLEAARRDRAALLIVDRMLNGIDSLPMIETLRKEGLR
ncbi:MAG: response regulator, partial [Methylocella sp.]